MSNEELFQIMFDAVVEYCGKTITSETYRDAYNTSVVDILNFIIKSKPDLLTLQKYLVNRYSIVIANSNYAVYALPRKRYYCLAYEHAMDIVVSINRRFVTENDINSCICQEDIV